LRGLRAWLDGLLLLSPCSLLRRRPPAPPFPCTTLFRSVLAGLRPPARRPAPARHRHRGAGGLLLCRVLPGRGQHRARLGTAPARSEEHTSELQSRENLVCRLLLAKKNSLSGTDIVVIDR